MTGFSASYLELEPRELVRYLLREAAQCDRAAVNPKELLDLLKLEYLSFDFARELPDEAKETVGGGAPRALLSFNDRVVATDESLDDRRTRFSVLHEIGHYVLPHHEHTLYVCDDFGLSFATRLFMEKEANEFAADLLFLGDRFSLEANGRAINALAVKELAEKYKASFESTARRLVEKNFRPCMLLVFKESPGAARLDDDEEAMWKVKYCVSSPTFKTKYFERLSGSVPQNIVSALNRPGRDIADSISAEISVPDVERRETYSFCAEYFSNSYNIFCLLTPNAR